MFRGWLQSLYRRFARVVERHPFFLLVPVVAASVAAGFYAYANLAVNANTAEMFPDDLPFRMDRERFLENFPQLDDSILVVVRAATPEAARSAADKLEERLRASDGPIRNIHRPTGGEFFRRHGFLFQSSGELDERTTDLARAQPILSALARDPSLRGLFNRLTDVLREDEDPLTERFADFLEAVEQGASDALAERYRPLSWQRLLSGGNEAEGDAFEILTLQAELDFSRLLRAKPAIETLRSIIGQIKAGTPPSVSIRLSGDEFLEYEEMKAAMTGTVRAGLLSLLMVTCVLAAALRSVRLIAATLLTLLCGLSLTTALALLFVGAFNMISVAFAVLYIGLGVDYAIHFCLRFRQGRWHGETIDEAAGAAIRRIGPALALCAVSTAIGFLAFVPSDFNGVSDLGIIAATGIVVSFGVTMTLLPGLLKLIAPRTPQPPVSEIRRQRSAKAVAWFRFPERRYRLVGGLSLAVGVVALALVPRIGFDADPLNLRDPESESVSTLRSLMERDLATPHGIELLADDPEKVRELEAALEDLPSVSRVAHLFRFIPDNQREKLERIHELELMLLGVLPFPESRPEPPPVAERVQAIESFLGELGTLQEADEAHPVAARLASRLESVLEKTRQLPGDEAKRFLNRFGDNLLDSLPATMADLEAALGAEEIDRGRLPEDLRRRWLSEEGTYRLRVIPSYDHRNEADLRAFADDVTRLAGDATGDLIIAQRAGDIVVEAFRRAFLLAFLAITFLLWWHRRSWIETGLILLPLLLGAALTTASTVLLDMPFNFANIIALPLLLGLGVDNGIHVVHRMRQAEPGETFLLTSTARAVFYSSLTTIVSFGSLAFAPHRGMASMGLILTIGILFILLTTLFSLPAFYTAVAGSKQSR